MADPKLIASQIPKILFEDTHVLVISKPAGLLSQGESTGDANVVDWARQHLGRNYVGLIHRLDRNTSGILILAKRTKAAQRLTDQLQSGRLTRTYLAWLEGKLERAATWRHLLVKDHRTNQVRVVQSSEAKEAVLHVTPVRTGLWKTLPLTLASFTLETGRSHQIRVQAAAEKHPLLGDPKYGSGKTREFGRPALHSHRIEFDHPISGERILIEDPLPEDMQAVGI